MGGHKMRKLFLVVMIFIVLVISGISCVHVMYQSASALMSTIDICNTVFHAPSTNFPVNYTALAYAKRHNWGDAFVYEKDHGTDLQIFAQILNAVKFSGTVTDPTGLVHRLNPVVSNSTEMQIQFNATLSDPDGKYVATFNVVNGSNTSDLCLIGEITNHVQPPVHPSLKIPIFLSPLMQFKTGTPVNDVKCNDGLQLIIKAEDGSPACIKPDTSKFLIERGWAKALQ